MKGAGKKKLIGTMLVEAGLISEAQLNEGLRAQKERGGKIVENLIAMESLDGEAFTKFLAQQPGVPRIEIQRYGVSSEILALIPKSFAIKHEIFPLDRMGNHLTVGMVCPLDVSTIAELEELSGLHVMPLLCSASDLKASIERYYGTSPEPEKDEDRPVPEPETAETIGTSLKLSGIPALVRRLESLPALPITIHKVREAVEDPEASLKEVGRIIGTDPPLAAKLLQIANSPAYGFPQQITSVPLAVSLLGLEETYSVALSAAVVDLFHPSGPFDYKTFWIKSMLCGSLAKLVARSCGLDSMPGVFTAGLLLDIGRLALADVAPQRYGTIDPGLRDVDLILAEETTLGIAHPEAGYLLVSGWGLPEELAETIRFHHMPEYATQSSALAAVASVADEMTGLEKSERDCPQLLMERCSQSLETLKLKEAAVQQMLEEMKSILSSAFLLRRKWESDTRGTQRAQ